MAREEYEARGLEHIRAGLTQRRTGPGHSFATAVGSPRDAGALAKIFAKATAAHEKLVGICDGIVAEMIVAGVATDAELAQYRGVLPPVEIGNQRRRKLQGKRAELLAIGMQERARLAVELSEYFSLVEGVRDEYQSPVSFLMTRTLSDRKLADARERTWTLIQHCGEREIVGYVKDAVSRGDKGALAACFMRVDQIVAADPEARNRLSINKAETADLLVRQERMTALCAIEQTSLLVARANVAVTVAETGDSPNSLVKIDLGQRQKRLDSMIAATFPEDDPENPAPSDRIRNPLSE